MMFDANAFKNIADSIVDSLVQAAVEDLADPDVRNEIKLRIERNISKMLGIDVNMPLVKPFWDRFTGDIYNQLFEFAGFIKSDPPDSVYVASDYVKDKSNRVHDHVNNKIDSMTSELAERLSKKKESI